MGIGQKIAITGGGIIAAILLVAYAANKTNILDLFKTGLGKVGQSVGGAVGGAVGNIPLGFFEGLGGSFVSASKDYDPFGFKKAYADFLASIGVTDPFAAYNPDPAIVTDPRDPTVTPQNRAWSDVVAQYAAINANRKPSPIPANLLRAVPINAKVGYNAFTGKTSSLASASKKVSVSAARGPAVRGGLSKSKAKARKKARSCYNEDLSMGGINKIDYRLSGIVRMHG